MKDELEKICNKYNLGYLEKEPELVTGGLMHKMYHVSTTQGEYAIKQLNPDIMKRPTALHNMINSEIVASALKDSIPLIATKKFDGKNVIESDGLYYMIFDWFEGKSVFAPDISTYHCEQIGRILGKIHASDVNVVGMERNEDSRDLFDWKLLLETAKQQNEECHTMLEENLSDIEKWDNGVVDGWKETAKKQVISHCDLDPKNVMWQDDLPYIIDWESAGFVNPYQELIEVLNYWITDEEGKYNKEKFDALMQAYTESVDICGVNWEVVLSCSFDGMLGWLEYSVKRALGLEGSGEKERQEGMKQTKGTICELRKYEAQMAMLKDWIDEYVKRKY